ncbi:MAG: hypothetical protein ACREBV_02450, partial [Candidatus Zixiibacteriota bacterium]
MATILFGFTLAASAVRDLTIINSSSGEFHFAVAFDSRMAFIDQQVGLDSLMYSTRAIQIAVPFGAHPQIILSQGN